ncbi:MAG: hypothetical protein ACREQQ_05955, partial [Candidatus Binatia bacterium]
VLGLILIISLLTFALAAVAAARRGGVSEEGWQWVRGGAGRFVTAGETARPYPVPVEGRPTR